jgi:hypothetical protein
VANQHLVIAAVSYVRSPASERAIYARSCAYNTYLPVFRPDGQQVVGLLDQDDLGRRGEADLEVEAEGRLRDPRVHGRRRRP